MVKLKKWVLHFDLNVNIDYSKYMSIGEVKTMDLALHKTMYQEGLFIRILKFKSGTQVILIYTSVFEVQWISVYTGHILTCSDTNLWSVCHDGYFRLWFGMFI